MKKKRKVTIERVRGAGRDHAVISVKVNENGHRIKPCAECPWRRDLPTGVFPAEAYRISAPTSYDQAMTTFACHMAGSDNPINCAGFLLRGADHSLAVRIKAMKGKIDVSKVDSDFPLYDSYREMAIANGVSPDDPVLQRCRANDE